MEPTTVAILAATAANAVVVLGALGLWLGYRTRRIERREQLELERSRRLLEPVEARLVELTRGVDAIAIEVERVAQAQRYLAGLMPTGGPARLDSPPATPRPRIVTPH